MSDVIFNRHNVTNGTHTSKVRYHIFDSKHDVRKHVNVYATDYKKTLGLIIPNGYTNRADTENDYSDNGSVTMYEDHPLYAAALARAQLNDIKQTEEAVAREIAKAKKLEAAASAPVLTDAQHMDRIQALFDILRAKLEAMGLTLVGDHFEGSTRENNKKAKRMLDAFRVEAKRGCDRKHGKALYDAFSKSFNNKVETLKETFEPVVVPAAVEDAVAATPSVEAVLNIEKPILVDVSVPVEPAKEKQPRVYENPIKSKWHRELLLLKYKSDDERFSFFDAMPAIEKTVEKLVETAKHDWQMLQCIPVRYRTREVCEAAIFCNGFCSGMAIDFTPESLITEACAWRAVSNGARIGSIPKKFVNEGLRIAAVKFSRLSLNEMRDEEITSAVCFAAVEAQTNALVLLPLKMRTRSICMMAIKKDGFALIATPNEHIDEELCLAAVKQNGLALEEVPEELRTVEIYQAAVTQDPMALKFVPVKFHSPHLCLDAVWRNQEAAKFVAPDVLEPMLALALPKRMEVFLETIKSHTPDESKAIVSGVHGTFEKRFSLVQK